MNNSVKTYQTVQSNLKPLTKMVGMYGYAEKIKKGLSVKGVNISLFVIYRAIEGTSKSEYSTSIRKMFLEMVQSLKKDVNEVEENAKMLLN